MYQSMVTLEYTPAMAYPPVPLSYSIQEVTDTSQNQPTLGSQLSPNVLVDEMQQPDPLLLIPSLTNVVLSTYAFSVTV